MTTYKYVIIGGGTTAGYAAQEFAEQGIGKSELCIISAESILPMNRPPLSKQYLKDEDQDDDILINGNEFYQENGIEVKLETCARSLDFSKQEVELDSGEVLKYEKLLIATGSSLNHLGVDGSNLDNIFYLRNIIHADKIREKAKKSENAVIVGGGYIGTEAAASLSEMGMNVTMVIPEDRLLSRFTNEEMASYFKSVYRDHDIDLRFKDKVVSFHGNGAVEEVGLSSGERIPADLVVVGIGVSPNVKLFEGKGLNLGHGIQVNEYCETGVKNVYAAGDVVEFPDMIFNKLRHVEHWEHAFEQGQHAAKIMMGKREPYIFVPYFFSDIFDLSYEYFGDQEKADYSVTRGNLDEGDFSHWWFRKKQVVAAFIMSSRPREEADKAREWISKKTTVDHDRMGDENVDLNSLEQQSEEYSDEPKP